MLFFVRGSVLSKWSAVAGACTLVPRSIVVAAATTAVVANGNSVAGVSSRVVGEGIDSVKVIGLASNAAVEYS